MARIISLLVFALALAASPMASNPFGGTDTTVQEEGTLNIAYTGLDNVITITDAGEGSWQVTISNGGATWAVPGEAEELLVLSDSYGNDFTVRIVEG